MKAERRHELKHNALDAELVKVLDYLKKHVKGIILATVAIVAAISLGASIIRSRAEAVSIPRKDYDNLKRVNTATAEGRTTALVGFEKLAKQTGNPQVAALACVEAGDICLSQLVAGDAVEDRTKTGEKAREHYQRVIDEFAKDHIAAGRAHLGLARLAEGKNDLAAAKTHYDKIVDLGDETSELALNGARSGLKALASLKDPIRLATTRPAPWVAPAALKPTSQPASQPATAPAGAR